MNVELINTGSELLLGRVLNTHQQWLCRRLADLGYVVSRQVAVGDSSPEIQQAVREALGRADLLITTGGLGPTSDDLTRECLAQMLGRALREDATVRARLEQFFQARGRPVPERTRAQALVPEGAVVLENHHGTAPGLAMEIAPNPFRNQGRPSWLILLPGPPRELRPMFDDSVAPLLARVLPPQHFVCRTLSTTGLGESVVEQAISGPLQELVKAGLELGYCARPGQVKVRLAARSPQAEDLVKQAQAIATALLGPNLYASNEEELEAVVVHLLAGQARTLALAESCTGGCIAHRLTNVPGASAVLRAAIVTYSNDAKQKFLGVQAETLDRHGAISEPVARQMAEGARRQTGADYAVAVTGIAGPGGGTAAKPVGTVFIALAGPSGTQVERHFNPYDRQTFKDVTARQALDLLRRAAGPSANAPHPAEK